MGWSEKYKKSIDCSNPKGFSQKAHCAGRKKRKNEMNENLKEIILDILTEGVDDPGILKCVFMAGGPGSGKSFTAKEIFGVGKGLTQSFSASGLKIVNSDTAFEKGLKDNGINPKELGKIEKEDPELWDKITGKDSIRSKAKALTQKQQSFYEAGRLGMIIDGTGDEVSKIKKKKQHAEKLGYDCYMVFVNTSLEVALERNANRDRVLPDDLVTDIWKACQNNLGAFQTIFSGNFVIVDNTVYKPINKTVQKAVDSFIRKPIYNRIGKKWIETARALKKARLIKAGKEIKGTPVNEAKRSDVYKAVKGGSFPVSLVVIKNGKVIDQELVNTPMAVPAAFNVIQSKHKGAIVHIEDKTGKRLFSESVINEFLRPSDVDSVMKELGIKKIPISSQGERILKSMAKEGFIDKVTNKERLIYFYQSLGNERFGYSVKGKPLSPLVSRFSNDLMSDGIFFGGRLAAWNVATNIKDRLANREEVDSTYYMLKDYFNSFGMDTNRSRVFNSAAYELDKWLKRNKKIASQIGENMKEAYKGNMSDFKYEFPNTFEDETGNSTKAIKKVSKKGKGYEVRTSTYMSEPEMKKVGDALGLKLVKYQKSGNIAITLYESVNEGKNFKRVKKDKYGNHLEPQFKKGDKVTYLGNKAVITRVNRESGGVYSYDVDYYKGNGRTKASNIFNKDGKTIQLESVNEGKFKPSQVRSAISKVKKGLMRKWKQKGGYENFGQKELSQMKDKFDYNPYGTSDEREISKMLDGFDNWAMNYDGNMREALEERVNLFFEENCPTDASKWSYYKGQAKKKFDVYPSAYANGWAAKQYKAAGGGWKKCK